MPHTVHIGRMVSNYFVSRDHPAPEQVRSHFADIVEDRLPRALLSMFDHVTPEEDESIWVIRRLDLAFDVDLSWDGDELARCWTAHFARAVSKLVRGGSGPAAIHFRSRAEYLAAFLSDLADGVAWNKWQYACFDGLRLLPISSALRTVICDEVEEAVGGMCAVTLASLRRIVAALLAQDALQVWTRLSRNADAGGPALERALAIWSAERSAMPARACPERAAIWLLIRTLQESAKDGARLDAPSAAAAVDAIVALEVLHSQFSSEQWTELSKALPARSFEAMAAPARGLLSSSLELWSRFPACLETAAAVLQSECSAASGTPSDFRITSLGAIFLLLPLLDELPAEDWAEDAALFRFAVFVRCCAADSRSAAGRDPFLRDLFGIAPDSEAAVLEPRAGPGSVIEWMHRADRAMSDADPDPEYLAPLDTVAYAGHAVLRRFAWKLPGFATASLPHLWTNFLDFPARVDLEPERIVVRLSRPPLHVILRIAGLTSAVYTLPRFDSRPFRLFLES